MKLCQVCGQSVAEEIRTCPVCGVKVSRGIERVDDYQILKVIREGHSSILCQARHRDSSTPVMLRLFTSRSGVDDTVAERLTREIKELEVLPEDGFVRHYAIRRSSEGRWYRVSQWVDAIGWGDLLTSGRLKNERIVLDLFYQMASTLEILHRKGYFIPHLILDDILVVPTEHEKLTIKIDYKLSRFLDPKLSRAGPMLKRLLVCHPDVTNFRPLDLKSEIWSLGKVFADILTADFKICDAPAQIDRLLLPGDIKILIKTMLAEEPALRPRSMAEIAQVLLRFIQPQSPGDEKSQCRQAAAKPPASVRTCCPTARLPILALILSIALGLSGLYVFLSRNNADSLLAGYANRYAKSIAFVMVQYWLESPQAVIYHNQTEGTAFLVNSEKGYLLTNRHVACPWLADRRLINLIAKSPVKEAPIRFNYRIYLWFEGEKAFFQSPELGEDSDPTDAYYLDTAYRSDGAPHLTIAGVAKSPAKSGSLQKAPLSDDFAVLQIDRVPTGLKPIPLAMGMDPKKISRLSPVIALGFPLGRQTQDSTINVSVTKGNVRRSFDSLLQVDTSIHRGNSGGPIIDTSGRAIGIASGVATELAQGPLPVVTPLSDIGMVLPITEAVEFLSEIQSGQIKWKGTIDPGIDGKIDAITQAASAGKWQAAIRIAEENLKQNPEPNLFLISGMLHFCAGQRVTARQRFEQVLSMNRYDNQSRLMLYVLDWMAGHGSSSPFGRALMELDWRSPDEFFGYWVKIVEKLVKEGEALSGWDRLAEKSWIYYGLALMRFESGQLKAAEELATSAALLAEADEWSFFLSRSLLEMIQDRRARLLVNTAQQAAYKAESDRIWLRLKHDYLAKLEKKAKLAGLYLQLAEGSAGMGAKVPVLEDLLRFDPGNAQIYAELAFHLAADEKWAEAQACAEEVLRKPGRESSSRLSLGLLVPQILLKIGKLQQAEKRLAAYSKNTRDPWYRSIGQHLEEQVSTKIWPQDAARSPEQTLTAHTALGFWAEAHLQPTEARKHYKEAMASYLDNWVEYDFAKERFKRLKRPVTAERN